jgi:hypothetical protein
VVKDVKISALDPSFGTYVTMLAIGRRFDEMIAALSPLASDDKNVPPLLRSAAHAALASFYMIRGDRDRAVPFRLQAEEERKTFEKQERLPPLSYGIFIQMEARFGDRDTVERAVKRMFNETGKDKWQYPSSETAAAIGYMLLGDLDRALSLLQDALAHPSEGSLTPGYLRLDPIWDPMRNDPRFQKLASSPAPKS